MYDDKNNDKNDSATKIRSIIAKLSAECTTAEQVEAWNKEVSYVFEMSARLVGNDETLTSAEIDEFMDTALLGRAVMNKTL